MFKYEKYGYIGCINCFKNERDKNFKIKTEIIKSRKHKYCMNGRCALLPDSKKKVSFICTRCKTENKEKFTFCINDFKKHLRSKHGINEITMKTKGKTYKSLKNLKKMNRISIKSLTDQTNLPNDIMKRKFPRFIPLVEGCNFISLSKLNERTGLKKLLI